MAAHALFDVEPLDNVREEADDSLFSLLRQARRQESRYRIGDALKQSPSHVSNRSLNERPSTSAIQNGIAVHALSDIVGRMNHLVTPQQDEDADVPATQFAYKAARSIVESTYGLLLAGSSPHLTDLPTPVITTGDRGGLRLSWQKGQKHVRISFAAAQGQRSYLYFESPNEHDIEDLAPPFLSKRLDWMLKP